MLVYKCGSTEEEINLSSEHIKGRIKKAGFHDYEWKPEERELTIGTEITGFSRGSQEYELILDFIGTKKERAEHANTFFEMTERDVLNKTPGKIYLNGYYIVCYVIGAESGGRDDRTRAVQKELKILAPQPFWIAETLYNFQNYGVSSSSNKKYPYAYPYRYANGMNNAHIVNLHFFDANFRLTIYGPVTNPQVNIGGVPHLVNIILEEGERLEIDSKSETVTKIMINGESANAFHNRKKGQQIFSRIPPGRQEVSWTGKFAFDLIVYEERSELKWIG